MSNVPPYQPTNIYVNQPAPSNGLGLAGFIVSLVGIVSCGILSPIGLVLSLFGLARTPRGFAIAGTVIGGLGTLFMALFGIGMVMAILGLGKAIETVGQAIETQQNAQKAYAAIERTYSAASEPLPTKQVGDLVAARYFDAWKTPLRYEPASKSYDIVSAGPDKQFGTQDDLRFDQEDLAAPAFTTGPSTTLPAPGR